MGRQLARYERKHASKQRERTHVTIRGRSKCSIHTDPLTTTARRNESFPIANAFSIRQHSP